MKEKFERALKRKCAQAVQRGRLRAAALSVWFFVLFLLSFSWRVLGCGARARSAKVCGAAIAAPQCLKAALVYSNTRHSAIRFFTYDLYLLFASKSAIIILYTDAHTTILAGNSSTATTPYPSNIMTFALRQSFCF